MLQPILATRIAAARSMLTTGVLVIGVARRKSQKHHMKTETGYPAQDCLCGETDTHTTMTRKQFIDLLNLCKDKLGTKTSEEMNPKRAYTSPLFECLT